VPASAVVGQKVVNSLLLAAGAVSVGGASAQSRWMHSLTVPAEMEYDSNPSMTPGPSPGGTLWLRLTPSLSTKYVYGNDEFSLESILSAEKSSNTRVAQDRLDPHLRAAWKHAAERDTTEVAAVLDRRAFRDLALNQQVPLGVDGTQTTVAFTGNWTHDLDARTAFTADVRQEWDRSTGGLTPDYRRTTGAARVKRAWDARTNWYTGLNAQAVRPDGTGAPGAPVAAPASTAYGAVVGVERAFGENFRVDANAGPLRFTQPAGRTDWQGSVTAEYTGARFKAGVDLLRTPSVDATAAGLAVTDEVRLRLHYDLGPLSRLEADAGASRERATGSSRMLASVAWVRELNPEWQLVIKGSTQRQQGPTGTARSNLVGVKLVYTGLDL
jgi:hypothetical protein